MHPMRHNFSRRHFCGMTCSTLALGAAGCAVNPATGRSGLMLVSPGDERKIGAEEHPKVIKEFGGVYNDPKLSGYVTAVGNRLARTSEQPGLGYTFTLLDNPIVNAFALPGGYVYITRGLMALAGSEAELAGVLGHELGHVVARHGAQRQSKAILAQIGAGLLGAVTGSEAVGNLAAAGAGVYLRGFSREQELEADRLGVRYLSRAGYDPGAMSSFLEKMRANSRLNARIAGQSPDEVDKFDIMSTHPRSAKRVRQAIELTGATAGRGAVERDSYLRRLDRMIYGDSPRQGYARGQVFAHPELRFTFQAPAGFRLRNAADKVAALGPDDVIILFDRESESFTGGMTAYISDKWAEGKALVDLRDATIGGMKAATARTTIESGGKRLPARLAAVRFASGRIYRFLGVAPAGSSAALATAFQRTAFSLRRLSAREAAALKPWRLRVVPARPGDTAYGLSRRTPFADFAVERFQVLNGLAAGQPLAAGALVKLVAE